MVFASKISTVRSGESMSFILLPSSCTFIAHGLELLLPGKTPRMETLLLKYGKSTFCHVSTGGKRSLLSLAYKCMAIHNRFAFSIDRAAILFSPVLRMGCRSIDKNRVIGRMSELINETPMPAQAIVFPFIRPRLFLMIISAKIPRMRPAMAVMPKVQKPRIPRTRLAMAMAEIVIIS